MMKIADIKILPVEDNPGDARLILEMLKEDGQSTYDIIIEGSVSASLKNLQKNDYDIIILDLNLPDSSGLQTLDMIINFTGNLIPVIVLTGLKDEETGISGIERGAEDYLIKDGLDPARLKRSIRYAIERKKMHHDLLESEDRFRKLHESMIDAFVQVDMDGKIVSYNTTYLDMLGYTTDELKQMTYSDLTPEKWHPMEADIVENQILKHGYSEIYEKEYMRKDGTIIPIEMRTSLLVDKAGNPAGMWAIVRDISERKRAEIALVESELRYRTLADSGQALIWTSATDKGCDYLNKPWLTFTGQAFEHEKGYGWAEGIYPEDRDQCLYLYNNAFDLREPFSIVYRLRRYDGEYRWIQDNGLPRYNVKGEFLGYIGHCLDITDRKLAESRLEELYADLEKIVASRTAELEKINMELDSFSYSISHDLRAPLRHISGFLEMLRREIGDLPNEKVRHYMDVIEESSIRMGQLIDDLLAFTRLGRNMISKQDVRMDLLTDDVLREYSDDIRKGNVSVIRHPLPVVKGDRAMLRVVLTNLISNALKFTSNTENPEFEIGYDSDENDYVFYVRDNGAGFDMRYAEKLFGVFQRLHSDREFKGTGIGLAMVKSVIERHNGSIRAEGEPGKGAVVYFTIPRDKADYE